MFLNACPARFKVGLKDFKVLFQKKTHLKQIGLFFFKQSQVFIVISDLKFFILTNKVLDYVNDLHIFFSNLHMYAEFFHKYGFYRLLLKVIGMHSLCILELFSSYEIFHFKCTCTEKKYFSYRFLLDMTIFLKIREDILKKYTE